MKCTRSPPVRSFGHKLYVCATLCQTLVRACIVFQEWDRGASSAGLFGDILMIGDLSDMNIIVQQIRFSTSSGWNMVIVSSVSPCSTKRKESHLFISSAKSYFGEKKVLQVHPVQAGSHSSKYMQ